MAEHSRTIIVYRTGQLGDTLVSLPAIRAIHKSYPNHKFVLLTDRQSVKGYVSSWEVLEATKIFSEALFYRPPSGDFAGWASLIELARQIRRRKPEALFSLRDPHWNHERRDRFFFQKICGVRSYYGLSSQTKNIFGRRDSSGHLISYKREADCLLEIVASAGIPIGSIDKAAFALPLSDKERLRVDFLLHEKGLTNRMPIIGMAPGSKMPAKRWPLERFIEVAKLLLANFGEYRIIIFGGSEDYVQGEAIRKAIGKGIINLAGELSLLEAAEALRRCSVYVGNDTGTMHLAAATGIPCVVIFSARDHPGRWDPLGSHHVLLRTNPPCAGCMLENCVERDMQCLKEISVTDVSRAVESIIRQPSIQRMTL